MRKLALLRILRRPRREVGNGRPSRAASATRKTHKALMRELSALSEAQKRQRLLELLQADTCGEEHDGADPKWTMPALTADGRTTDAGDTIRFDHTLCELRFPEDALQLLRKTCRLAFAMSGSSWLPCKAKPRCLAESLAAAVFEHHAAGATFDSARSGAEWWAQVRHGGHEEEAIQFHWDTDEVAVERHGVNIHPHVSTVTYFSNCGAPTLVLDRRNPLRPAELAKCAYGPIRQGLFCRPKVGRHISFDGQLLHGTAPHPDGEHGERITFLVNVWLNHRPSNCFPVPRGLAKRLGPPLEGMSLTARQRPPVMVASAQYGTFETTFGRRRHDHRLRVSLLPPDCGVAAVAWGEGTAGDCAELCSSRAKTLRQL